MYSRTNPYTAQIKERELLTKESSSKKTYHIVLTIDEPLPFKVGDSIGVLPSNDPNQVDQIIERLGKRGDETIQDPKTGDPILFRDFLLHKANISKVSFHKLIEVEKSSLPLIEQLKYHRPEPQQLCNILLPLLPRFYSIASSPRVYPSEIHLTVGYSSYELNGTLYSGVGSHFLCEGAHLFETVIPIYVQPSHHFTLPEDPNSPLIMIGPGTGIAPFRAFLQERIATQAEGAHWLFFGERNQSSDFYYADYWTELVKQGRLRLDTAFSRDQNEKIYVQHKMWERRKTIWNWIENHALIYVCGDANEMAKGVEAVLLEIVRVEGNMNEEEGRQFLKKLKQAKRYLLDVY